MSNQQQYPQGPQQQWQGQQPWQGQPTPPVKSKKKHPILMAFSAGAAALVVLAVAVAAFGDDPKTDPAGAAGPVPSSSAPAPQASQPTTPAQPAPKPSATTPATQPSKPKPAGSVQECGDDAGMCTVTPGKAFHHGKHLYPAGWKVTGDGPFDTFDVKARVTNTSDADSGVFASFTFIKNGEEVGSVMCTTSVLKPGQKGFLNCIGGDDFTKFDEVTIE